MADFTIVYWRDIPAQLLAGRGRAAVRVALSERFEQAIDRAAMAAGAAGTDAYLAEWRRVAVTRPGDDAEAAARAEAARIEAEYDTARLAALIARKGHAEEPRE
jgi:hypothetical protein